MPSATPQAFFEKSDFGRRIILDVRSPGEHAAGKLPDAKSLPLFTDAERAEVGTLYKQSSPDDALLRGLEIAGEKMRWLVETARELAPDRRVLVHCWRGGDRSGSVAWLLEKAGFDVLKLEGGYKGFRKYVRQYLGEEHHRLRVLSGPTGSAKTEILKTMRNQGAYVVDLEALANHKGSSFGALGEEPQPRTEEFENQLFAKLKEIPEGETIWLEDESRMIGTVYQPDEFYDRLVAAPVYELIKPLEWRVEHLVRTYSGYPKHGLGDAFTRIRKKLGGQHLNTALEALKRDDFATAARVALVYYDKAYAHYGERRRANVVVRIEAAAPDHDAVATQVLTA